MVKSPIEYFESLDFSPGDSNLPLNAAEEAFIKKYIGNVPKLEVQNPEQVMNFANSEKEKIYNIDAELKKLDEILLVSFNLGTQEYTIPILAVKEVIHYAMPSLLPLAPSFVSGVINLRGRINPVINLSELLEEKTYIQKEKDRYIIICDIGDLQIGLQISKIKSLYRAKQEEIKWNVETCAGLNGDYLSGLFINGEKIIAIISLDKIIAEI